MKECHVWSWSRAAGTEPCMACSLLSLHAPKTHLCGQRGPDYKQLHDDARADLERQRREADEHAAMLRQEASQAQVAALLTASMPTQHLGSCNTGRGCMGWLLAPVPCLLVRLVTSLEYTVQSVQLCGASAGDLTYQPRLQADASAARAEARMAAAGADFERERNERLGVQLRDQDSQLDSTMAGNTKLQVESPLSCPVLGWAAPWPAIPSCR